MLTVLKTKYQIHNNQNCAVVTFSASEVVEVAGDAITEGNARDRITMLCYDSSELYGLDVDDTLVGTLVVVHKPTVEKVNNVYFDFIVGEPTEEEIWQRVSIEKEFNPEDDIPLNCLITKKINIMDLGFLNDLTLKAVEVTKQVAKRELPTGMKIRVYEKGQTYPSQEMVDAFNMEYTDKNAENKGYGMDVFKSIDFQMIPEGMPNFMLCAIVPRGEVKVDLFAFCKYGKDDNGVEITKASTSVTRQGTSTFGKKILAMVAETYGLQPKDGFIDLVVMTEHKQVSPNNVYVIPKEVSRRDKAGQLVYVTRGEVDVFPFIVDDATAKPIVVGEETTDNVDNSKSEQPVVAPVAVPGVDTNIPGAAPGIVAAPAPMPTQGDNNGPGNPFA